MVGGNHVVSPHAANPASTTYHDIHTVLAVADRLARRRCKRQQCAPIPLPAALQPSLATDVEWQAKYRFVMRHSADFEVGYAHPPIGILSGHRTEQPMQSGIGRMNPVMCIHRLTLCRNQGPTEHPGIVAGTEQGFYQAERSQKAVFARCTRQART